MTHLGGKKTFMPYTGLDVTLHLCHHVVCVDLSSSHLYLHPPLHHLPPTSTLLFKRTNLVSNQLSDKLFRVTFVVSFLSTPQTHMKCPVSF